uniref:Uncharacterized protein n=1 Tax=Rhizophora mucronata TaxID=61149 RepID=A0A2P2MY59_RHIMU
MPCLALWKNKMRQPIFSYSESFLRLVSAFYCYNSCLIYCCVWMPGKCKKRLVSSIFGFWHSFVFIYVCRY